MPDRISAITNDILNGYLSATGKESCRGMVAIGDYLALRDQAVKELSLGLHNSTEVIETEKTIPPVRLPESQVQSPAQLHPVSKSEPIATQKTLPKEEPVKKEITTNTKKTLSSKERFLALAAKIED